MHKDPKAIHVMPTCRERVFINARLPSGFYFGDFMFDRLISLIGKDNVDKINKVNVAIIGVGGVGGFALEALVRSGVCNITIFDGDTIDITNLNRQIITDSSNIGKNKVNVAVKRYKLINPDLNILGNSFNITEDNVDNLNKFDYVIDACDDIKAKVAMIKYCLCNNIKIVCALGTGKRLSPEGIKLTTLDKTSNDALARNLRQILRKAGISLKIPVVYNEDIPLNNDKTISSSIFSPGVAGLYLAYYVINDILKK